MNAPRRIHPVRPSATATRASPWVVLALLAASCAHEPAGATLEVRLRLPPRPVGTRVLVQVARGDAFAFDARWLVDRERQEAASVGRYDDPEGADLSFSVVSEDGPGELRLRLVYCPPDRSDDACANANPGELPHHWLLFPDPFFSGRRSRWHAVEPSTDVMAEWTSSEIWSAEPSLPWAPLPAPREPCAAGGCAGPTVVSRCEVWVPDCRSLVGGSFPIGTSFCEDGVHDADRCDG